MSFDTDLLMDRRRLRRGVMTWRLVAFAAAVIAVIGLGLAFAGKDVFSKATPQIARVSISGLITGDDATLKLLKDVSEASAVQAVVLNVNSPGGTVTGSEALHEAIRKLAIAKPTVATVDSVAASGGYIAVIGTDHIVSRGSSIVGSIGVIAQYPNFTRLLDTVGVKVDAVRSSPLKAQPDGVTPTPPEATAALQATVLDSYAWFKDLVKARRHLSDQELAAISDGRVFTGRQGLPLKLIDEIGGEDKAIDWLVREKKVAKDLPVRDWKRETQSSGRFPFALAAAELAKRAGFDALAAAITGSSATFEGATLDGLVSVWQPAGQN